MYITEVKTDDALDTGATAFSNACATNASGLGLTPANATEISGAATAFHTKLQAVENAKAALRQAITEKDAQKVATKAVIAKWAKTFRASTTISNALLAAVNVAPHNTPGVKSSAVVPTGLGGTIDGSGEVKLTWLRGANKYPTTFIIEKQVEPDGDWVLCGSTTRLAFTTLSAPGQYVAYRVTAMRNGTVSSPSAPFGFYFTAPALHLAA